MSNINNTDLYNAMIELQVLNYLYKVGNMNFIYENSISDEYFTLYRNHFIFLKTYYDKYKSLPSKETFQAKFANNFEWLNITDTEDYLLDRLNEAKIYRDLREDYKNIATLIKEEKSDEAIEKMAAVSKKLTKNKKLTAVDLITQANIRYDAYITKVENPSKVCVDTGIKPLNEIINGGWDRLNDSVTIVGRPGFGKTWWLIYFALAAAKQGLRVGFYSGEMDPEFIGYRLDTFLGNIPNGSLTHGNINIKDKYKKYLESLEKVVPGNIFCVTPDTFGGAPTVSNLRAFIEKYELDILFIDQYSLLRDERRGKSTVEKFNNLSEDLRLLQRLMKIPIIAASQLNREEIEDIFDVTKKISNSDRIGQDSTIVIYIERKENNVVVLNISKSRNTVSGQKLSFMWDINNGILNYIPTENDALGGSTEQEYESNLKSSSVF